MLSWIIENLSTIIICTVLIAVIAGIVIHLISNKKNGKTSCSCGCSDCAMSNICHDKK